MLRFFLALLLLGTSCMYAGDVAPHASLFACHGVEIDIFFEVCVGPDETPEEVWQRIELHNHYDCKCSIRCEETDEQCSTENTKP
jgi:hypothetical protein